MDIWSFLTLVILVFGIVMAIAGIFAAYFGAGKNRAYGLVLFGVGVAVSLIWAYLTIWSGIEPFCNVEVWTTMYNAIIDLIGVLIGALIAVGIFLVVVLKS